MICNEILGITEAEYEPKAKRQRSAPPLFDFMYEEPRSLTRDENDQKNGVQKASGWEWFKGNESPASVVFGCATLLLTCVTTVLVLMISNQSNDLVRRQNQIILAGTLPDISAYSNLVDGNVLTITVTNAGSRANFRSIEALPFLKFRYGQYRGTGTQYIPLYEAFPSVKPNIAGEGELGKVPSVSDLLSNANTLCEIVRSADGRVRDCELEILLVVRYQTNTAELYSNYFLFESDIFVQVDDSQVQRHLDRWENGTEANRGGFNIADRNPEPIETYVSSLIEEANRPPESEF